VLAAVLIPFEEVLVPLRRVERRLVAELLAPLTGPLTEAEWEAHGAGREPRSALAALTSARGLSLPPDELRRMTAERNRRFVALADAGELVSGGAADRVRELARRAPLGVLSRLPREETVVALKGARLFDRLTALTTGGFRRCLEDIDRDLVRLRKSPADRRACLALAAGREAVDEARAEGLVVVSVGARIGAARAHAGSLEELDLDALERELL
jgi:hypothetical protein